MRNAITSISVIDAEFDTHQLIDSELNYLEEAEVLRNKKIQEEVYNCKELLKDVIQNINIIQWHKKQCEKIKLVKDNEDYSKNALNTFDLYHEQLKTKKDRIEKDIINAKSETEFQKIKNEISRLKEISEIIYKLGINLNETLILANQKGPLKQFPKTKGESEYFTNAKINLQSYIDLVSDLLKDIP